MTSAAQFATRLARLGAVVLVAAGSLIHAQGGHGTPVPLADVVTEADNNNTEIAAAVHAWRAAQLQSGADTGAQNAPGIQQSAGTAQLEAATQSAQAVTLRAAIEDRVKTIYLRLAYLYQMYDIDDRAEKDLSALIETQQSRYARGLGSQSEALQARIERTRIVRKTTLEHEEVGGLQAELKGLLHREPDSPDVIPEQTVFTHPRESIAQLLAAAARQNPALLADRAVVEAESARLDLLKQGIEPRAAIGFMLRHTGVDAPDNFILETTATGSHALLEKERASEIVESSRSEQSEDRLRQLAEVERQFTFLTSSEDLMHEAQDGLVPQSKALYQSELAAYQTGREPFGAVIQAFFNELEYEDDELQAILEHETSLAHLETLTGEKLR